ncbi:MAG: peptide ABC transporter substrate-binding protein [Candidatus Saccharimonadales bacterium]
MADQKRGWKQFQKLSFDSKRFSKRVKKAETATVRHARKFIVGRLDNIRSVRRQIVGWLVLVGCMLALVGVQMSWFQGGYETTTAAAGGTYAEASLGPIVTLNPLFATTSAEISASRLLFSSLYAYDETGHLRGDVAKTMSIDEQGRVYTITLRDGARWHDGVKLDAADIAFTIGLMKDPATRSSSTLRAAWQDVGVETLDDATIRFTLPIGYAKATFRHALTFAILPEHILGEVDPSAVRENVFSRGPVGSGPFQFRLLQTIDDKKQQKVVNLAAFDDYFRGTPLIRRFEIHSYADQDSIVTALRAGEVNAAADLQSVGVEQVKSEDFKVIARPVQSGVYALLNIDSPILRDKLVRQALQSVTNTSKIRQAVSVDTPPLDLPFVPGQLHGPDVPKVAEPDIVQAAALLDKAGWKRNKDGLREKKGETLALRVVTTKRTEYEKALGVLSGQWRELGVTLNTEVVDPTDPSANFVQGTLQQRNYDVLIAELAIGADPDVYPYWHSSQRGMAGVNLSNYANDTADAILSSARSRLEPELRNAKYISFAKQWLADAPAIGLYQPVANYVYNKHILSISPNDSLVTQYDRYANVLYWSVGQKSVYKTP